MLNAWSHGDPSALDRMMPYVYEELRYLAERRLVHERPDEALEPTELVHEVYLRLVDQHVVDWKERAQFFALSARIMRRVLVDHARRRHAARRGGTLVRQALDEELPGAARSEVEIAALEEVLDRLEAANERQSRVVVLRYFGGLTLEETAEVLGVSVATVKNDWNSARAWLLHELGGDPA
jgi:RNA polymerase sigma factor (TIGR02999 family)